MIKERIDQLRQLMKERKIDIYVIKTGDYHQSEYAGEYFNEREYMSGFTGSAGILVISKKKSVLFTDGRYFIQAENQLSGTDIQLMKSGVTGVPTLMEYLESEITKGDSIGFNGRTVEAAWGIELENNFANHDITIQYEEDLVDLIWNNRPELSNEQAFLLETCYAGESVKDKLNRLRIQMSKKNAQAHIMATLDDICWLFNIRGNDVKHNPVVLCFAIITKDEAFLFTDKNKFSDQIIQTLSKDNIIIKPYENIYQFVTSLHYKSLMLDPSRLNFSLYKMIPDQVTKVICENPTVLMKAIKNEIEISNMKAAHIKDGVAVTKFIYWLKENMSIQNNNQEERNLEYAIENDLIEKEISEISAAEYLEKCRKEQEGFIELSFDTICAYQANAAMMHYSATPSSNAVLKPEGMLLVDSGGQYYEGTTDITRTIALGETTRQMKKDFTLALKGMLNLSNAIFLYGCSGINLDILARGPLWNEGVDYRCGTGHGIGYLLNVHEAPNGFRWRQLPERKEHWILEEGMITSNEPGVYVEGQYGIRIENLIVCKKGTCNEYGQFMKFESLTLAPIDLDLVDTEYLNQTDINRLNDYHQLVYQSLSPYLNDKEKAWLNYNTRKISKL